MSDTMVYTGILTVEECCACGMKFAMPSDFQARKMREAGTTFYCPAGHAQHYMGKTFDAQLREAKERADIERANAQFWRRQRDKAERDGVRRTAAAKGVTTKLRKRIANGVCPCCKRSFANVAKHMAGQHPDYVEADA